MFPAWSPGRRADDSCSPPLHSHFRQSLDPSLSAGSCMSSGSRAARSASAAVRVVQSASAAVRLREARRFLDAFEPGAEVLLLGASRGAVDDLARAFAMDKGATFGLHRLSFTQFAARLAATDLAARGSAPVPMSGHEAVASRATFEAAKDEALEYFAPVRGTPGFPKALARTLQELRLAGTVSNA